MQQIETGRRIAEMMDASVDASAKLAAVDARYAELLDELADLYREREQLRKGRAPAEHLLGGAAEAPVILGKGRAIRQLKGGRHVQAPIRNVKAALLLLPEGRAEAPVPVETPIDGHASLRAIRPKLFLLPGGRAAS